MSSLATPPRCWSLLVGLCCCTPREQPVLEQTQPTIVESTPAPSRPAHELIVGRWRMIEEDPAYQQFRRLHVNTDGSFLSENYISRLEGRWQLDGDTLTLGEATARLVEVDDTRLVLIEDVPEIYLRGAPPSTTRITYRRVSERELGPMLGRDLVTSAPQPGSYAAAYRYRMDKLPTMEIAVRQSVDGRARMQLLADGSAHGCLAVRTDESTSISRYASDDGQHHTNEHGDRILVGWQGSWTIVDGHAQVVAEHSWRDSCTDSGDPYKRLGRLELECIALAANEVLPRPALACRIVESISQFHELALNPADTERAGPYGMQSDPMGHIVTDQGRPWLILGAPGLQVSSEDGSRDMSPTVTFTDAEVTIVEREFVPPP